jgi:hypothetical protein
MATVAENFTDFDLRSLHVLFDTLNFASGLNLEGTEFYKKLNEQSGNETVRSSRVRETGC